MRLSLQNKSENVTEIRNSINTVVNRSCARVEITGKEEARAKKKEVSNERNGVARESIQEETLRSRKQ